MSEDAFLTVKPRSFLQRIFNKDRSEISEATINYYYDELKDAIGGIRAFLDDNNIVINRLYGSISFNIKNLCLNYISEYDGRLVVVDNIASSNDGRLYCSGISRSGAGSDIQESLSKNLKRLNRIEK
ncbi:MAG: hypothetical protein LCH39_13770 [Proteobacteria bacterium]|nr:hypothetical protein [Pseudomonadota bacterium]